MRRVSKKRIRRVVRKALRNSNSRSTRPRKTRISSSTKKRKSSWIQMKTRQPLQQLIRQMGTYRQRHLKMRSKKNPKLKKRLRLLKIKSQSPNLQKHPQRNRRLSKKR